VYAERDVLTLSRLDHLGIYVRSLERAEEFYRNVLGLELHRRLPHQTLVRLGDVAIALMADADRAPSGPEVIQNPLGRAHHAFLVSDDVLVQALAVFRAAGIPHHGPVDWGDHDCLYFLDPDYNLLELVTERRPKEDAP
jgi:catechol 2,3-dioxygenase-like lactoylglutathione lyase family enzyme